ncbi:hypothetical protein MKK75_24465 [Methylobacterium sp. J-030]|uniref:hypothetical protein n=1 Tax=Methylobacterium sp. J-030 TaxID=2836627 RepID=UPI001FBC0D25|nr:hypothetical protein [Methylobacterium sp. J-030]MCJ2071915.1 hypothetical protein [Methylobacterium sp. J-030]
MAEPFDDPIRPVEIEHSIDAIFVEGRMEQYYNFFDYHFEQGDGYCRARSYADEMDKVVVHGPFAARDDLRTIENAAFEHAVHAYLKRRYRAVQSR